MKHSFFLLILLLALLACETSGKQPESTESLTVNSQTDYSVEESPDSVTQFLLASSASDFHKNSSSDPISFRNVRSGYITTESGQRQYILCGEYQVSNEGNTWTSFTTIKTSDYELWLGKQSGIYCDDTSAIWTNKEDLAALLQNKFDHLRNEMIWILLK